MCKIHALHRERKNCQTVRQRIKLYLTILEENLGMSRKEICTASGYHRSTISHHANGDGMGGESFALVLEDVLRKKLEVVRVLGTCAPPLALAEWEHRGIQLELLTIMKHAGEVDAVSLPEGVAAAWGAVGRPGSGCQAFVIALDRNIREDQAKVVLHELEELIAQIRKTCLRPAPAQHTHRAAW